MMQKREMTMIRLMVMTARRARIETPVPAQCGAAALVGPGFTRGPGKIARTIQSSEAGFVRRYLGIGLNVRATAPRLPALSRTPGPRGTGEIREPGPHTVIPSGDRAQNEDSTALHSRHQRPFKQFDLHRRRAG